MDRVKRIWYLLPRRAVKVQASLRIRAVSPEPPLLAHISSESRGTFRQKARSLAPLNGWACAVKICHDGMLEDTNSLDAAHIIKTGRHVTVCAPIRLKQKSLNCGHEALDTYLPIECLSKTGQAEDAQAGLSIHICFCKFYLNRPDKKRRHAVRFVKQ